MPAASSGASSHILLEGTPPGLDLAALGADLEAHIPAVAEIHHIHAWSLTAEQAMVTLHVRATPGSDAAHVVPAVAARLRQHFGIAHSTIQLDAETCPDEHHR